MAHHYVRATLTIGVGALSIKYMGEFRENERGAHDTRQQNATCVTKSLLAIGKRSTVMPGEAKHLESKILRPPAATLR